jgi:hypothetical protein
VCVNLGRLTLPSKTRAARRACVVAAMVVCALFASEASAHTVGLSQSDFTLEPDGVVRALVVFSKTDAMNLGRMDRNGDGIVSPAELASSEIVLREEMERGVIVVSDGKPCAPNLEGGGDVEDGFGVSLSFACSAPAHVLGVEMRLLRELPRGHRHALRISRGSASVEKILSAEDRIASLDVARAGDAAASNGRTAFASTLLGAVRMGVSHILTGWDHLLFLAALLIGARTWKRVVLAVSAFTVAHSITLAVSTLDVWAPNPRWIEPAIAASIAFVAFENAMHPRAGQRWRAAFSFGLVHGFGFAGALRGLGLDRDRRVPTLLGFNLGVEVAQLAIVVLAMPLVAWLCRRRAFETAWLRGVSVAMGAAGVVLCVARIARP